MIDDYSRELLRNGVLEARGGDREAARRYIERAIYMSSDHEVMAEGWYWISYLTDDPVEKRKALENCLSNDLQHIRARRELAILDGRLKAGEIVNPDALPPPPEGLQSVEARRFVCPKCGGRMSFSPDGQSLMCEFCSRNQRLDVQRGPARQEDFIVAMATVRGHERPLAEQVFRCQGCGAQFILPHGQLSAVCVYCGSPHVVNLEKAGDLLAPDGILPQALDQKQATRLLVNWVEGNKVSPEKQVDPPRGLYLPLWTFDLGGWVDYTAEVIQSEGGDFGRPRTRVTQITDRYPVLIGDFPIPASRKLSAPFVRLIATFDLKSVKPYEPGYLAAWPAELYDIPMAEASLDARSLAFAGIQRELPTHVSIARLISASSANMVIESFRLDLLPVWLTTVWFGGRSHLVLVNGQNGTVQSDPLLKPDPSSAGLKKWLADLAEG